MKNDNHRRIDRKIQKGREREERQKAVICEKWKTEKGTETDRQTERKTDRDRERQTQADREAEFETSSAVTYSAQ